MRPITSVYISGWEYNRLLQDDPTQPRNSALPASILWSGSHQLWMFETIYCSRESFLNEVEATDQLGWVNGEVLRDLAKEGAVKTIDWRALPVEITDQLQTAARTTLEMLPKTSIRSAIDAGDAPTLEFAKTSVLEPLLRAYGCIESGTPDSVNTWFASPAERSPSPRLDVSAIARPLIAGLQVCRPPGTGVSPSAVARQTEVTASVEKPMIPDLLAGEGEFAGERGFEPYFRRLEPYRDAYEPTNEQLRNDWRASKDDLLRLRDAAARHLWPELHHHWLPRLRSGDATASREFERWISSALRLRAISRFVSARPTRIIVGSFGPSALTAALAAARVPLPEAIVAGGVAALAGSAVSRHLGRVSELALFYQAARDIYSRKPASRWRPWSRRSAVT